MPNNDYILRSDALKAVRYYKNRREENHVPSIDDVHLTEYQLLAQTINSIPAADVEPVRHGRWIEQDSWGDTYYTCSICGGNFVTLDGASPEENEIHFCPMCGAKMDAEPPKGEDDG